MEEDLFEMMTDEEIDRLVMDNIPGMRDRKQIEQEMEDTAGEIREKLDTGIDDIDRLQEAFADRNTEKMEDICSDLYRKLVKIAERVAEIPVKSGCASASDREWKSVPAKDVKFEEQENGILHVILPEQLPHRPRYDPKKQRVTYYSVYDSWFYGYMGAFQKQFEYGKYRAGEGKVIMAYLHHTGSGPAQATDVDNYDTKDMTDIITQFVLHDDSFKYMSQYADIVDDGKDFTEVFIIPENKFNSWLTWKKNTFSDSKTSYY